MLPYHISKLKFPRVRLCLAQLDRDWAVFLPEPETSPGQPVSELSLLGSGTHPWLWPRSRRGSQGQVVQHMAAWGCLCHHLMMDKLAQSPTPYWDLRDRRGEGDTRPTATRWMQILIPMKSVREISHFLKDNEMRQYMIRAKMIQRRKL